MLRLLPISLLLVACASGTPAASRQPDGSWHLKCDTGLAGCVERAEALCKGGGYLVLGGKSVRTLYGAELGVSQVEVRKAELDVACANRRGDLPTLVPPATPSADAASTVPPAATGAASSAPAAAPPAP